jgi:hypothetical protein
VDPYLVLMDLDPDPGGQKTYGSSGSASATLDIGEALRQLVKEVMRRSKQVRFCVFAFSFMGETLSALFYFILCCTAELRIRNIRFWGLLCDPNGTFSQLGSRNLNLSNASNFLSLNVQLYSGNQSLLRAFKHTVHSFFTIFWARVRIKNLNQLDLVQ